MASDVPPTKSDDRPGDANDGGAPFEGGFELWVADGTAGGRERCWRNAGDQFSMGSHPSDELVLEGAAAAETAGLSRVYLYRLLGRYGLLC